MKGSLEKIFLNQQIKFASLKRWAIVGFLTFIIDYFIFVFLYTKNVSIFLSNFYSGITSMIFNYLAHYSWSFDGEKNLLKSGIKYIINFIVFWILGSLILNHLIVSGFEAKYAKMIYLPIVTPLSYFSLKSFVFNSQVPINEKVN